MADLLDIETVNGDAYKLNDFIDHITREFRGISDDTVRSFNEPNEDPQAEVVFESDMGKEVASVRIYSNGLVVLTEKGNDIGYRGDADDFEENLDFHMHDSRIVRYQSDELGAPPY